VHESSDRLVLRHWSLSWAGLALLTGILTALAVTFDESRMRVSLSCVRHETDPSHPSIEDIDCTMVRNSVRTSFELGKVTVHAAYQRMGGHMSHEPTASTALYFDVVLHRAFPKDDQGFPLFRFHSREAAERSGGQLEMWMKDASMSDDDVDEIDLEFGPPAYSDWLLFCGGAVTLVFAAQPLVEVANFDATKSVFVLTRRNLVGLRTKEVCHPIESIARAAVSEQLVPLTSGGTGGSARRNLATNRPIPARIQKAQRLSLLLRSWVVGERSYGDTGMRSVIAGDASRTSSGLGHAGLEVPLAMGELLFDPAGVAKTAGRVQRFLCNHMAPGYNPDDEHEKDVELTGAVSSRGIDGDRSTQGSSNSGGVELGRLRPCCACMEAPPDTVLLPCGHVNTCQRCAHQCELCPTCRRRVAKVQRVYF
jgi:hypothetical protein